LKDFGWFLVLTAYFASLDESHCHGAAILIIIGVWVNSEFNTRISAFIKVLECAGVTAGHILNSSRHYWENDTTTLQE